MQAYTNTARVNNIGLPPAVPASSLSYEARRALSMKKCQEPGPHAGRRRRWRRETQTRDALATLLALRTKPINVPRDAGPPVSLRELLTGGAPNRPGWVRALQGRGVYLLAQAEKHGPASGWGIAQPIGGAIGNTKWTPYWIGKSSEKCWRYWRRVTRGLRAVVAVLARAWQEVVPLHRERFEHGAAREKPEMHFNRSKQVTTGYRDNLPPEALAVWDRVRARLVM